MKPHPQAANAPREKMRRSYARATLERECPSNDREVQRLWDALRQAFRAKYGPGRAPRERFTLTDSQIQEWKDAKD